MTRSQENQIATYQIALDDNKEFSVGVFIDPNKVFYTVKYRILPKNLYHYGFRGTRLNGLQIICDRKQYVEYNNSVSKLKVITCGVSQGSILGPLLFSIYIHDIAACSSLLNIVLFADDTSIFCSSKVLNKLFHLLNLDLNELSVLFKVNNDNFTSTLSLKLLNLVEEYWRGLLLRTLSRISWISN